ncbi:DUF1674 domain-containing protein [Bartonella melophagi]|uniref:DUF1674 domain-containing protein n=1 Tax=Bartonella melophagi K-2C TaxID=1094557 RepID=J0R0S1_9HYPH|nr:DUF1674 domain-containing protein [Bartonella melophagi]EJF92041.1 hypothetical protein ME3_00264 [Bartonella melophagi K-2C]
MNQKDKTIKQDATKQNAAFLKQRSLLPEAQRALKEAAQRRKQALHENIPLENGGRGGKDPARYGDWEIKGRAIDF